MKISIMHSISRNVFAISICFVNFLCSLSSSGKTTSNKISLSPLTQNYFAASIDLSYKWQYSRQLFYAGTGFIINPPEHGTKPGTVFTNKAYASNFIQHFLIKAGHEYDIIHKATDIRLFTFAEIVFARTELKIEDYFPSISNRTYAEPPQYVLESNQNTGQSIININVNTGFGFEVPLLRKVSIQTRGGVSPGIIIHKLAPQEKSQIWGTSISFMFYSFTINYAL